MVPAPTFLPRLADMRKHDFLNFRRDLRTDGVMLLKVMTAMDLPTLQEALIVCDLRGGAQMIKLTEISSMSDEEKRNSELLEDIKTLIADPKMFKVVENVVDLVRLGERIFHRIDVEEFVPLDTWHNPLGRGFLPGVQYEYPQRYQALTLGFRGDRHPGWYWTDHHQEQLSDDQARLSYAVTSSLIGLTLDGIVYRLYGHEWERRPAAQLGETLQELVEEEVLLYLETKQLEAVGLTDTGKEKDEVERSKKKLRFAIFQGVTLAESLPFGFCREVEVAQMHDHPSRVLLPQRQYIQDIIDWEESLEFLHIVPAVPMTLDTVWEFHEPKRGCLKKYDPASIKIDRYASQQDPDEMDRGRIRFPNLYTQLGRTSNRTMSPPPRPDDPDGLREENRRRRQGLRPMGPPCKPGKPENRPFIRNLDWERVLPDDLVCPFLDEGSNSRRRKNTDSAEQPNKKTKTDAEQRETSGASANLNGSVAPRDSATREGAARFDDHAAFDMQDGDHVPRGGARGGPRGGRRGNGREGGRGRGRGGGRSHGRPYIPRGSRGGQGHRGRGHGRYRGYARW